MKIKITKVLFEAEQKMFKLPFPIYLKMGVAIKSDVLITKISKYKWPEERQAEYKDLCNRIQNWEKTYQGDKELAYEPSR